MGNGEQTGLRQILERLKVSSRVKEKQVIQPKNELVLIFSSGYLLFTGAAGCVMRAAAESCLSFW